MGSSREVKHGVSKNVVLVFALVTPPSAVRTARPRSRSPQKIRTNVRPSHGLRDCRLRASVRGGSSPVTERSCCDPSGQEKHVLCNSHILFDTHCSPLKDQENNIFTYMYISFLSINLDCFLNVYRCPSIYLCSLSVFLFLVRRLFLVCASRFCLMSCFLCWPSYSLDQSMNQPSILGLLANLHSEIFS